MVCGMIRLKASDKSLRESFRNAGIAIQHFCKAVAAVLAGPEDVPEDPGIIPPPPPPKKHACNCRKE